MNFSPTKIPDVIMIEPKVHRDGRGYFFESYNENLFSENKIRGPFVQDNETLSAKGVLRGLHYQIEPKAQANLMRVVRGEIFDVAVDIRQNSPTFGQYVGVTLSSENQRMLYIPTGFAHGYCVMKDETQVLYKVSNLYSPEHERGVIWNDLTLAIDWPKVECDFAVSAKDQKLPTLKQLFP